jgi:hypothetical protein
MKLKWMLISVSLAAPGKPFIGTMRLLTRI